MPIGKIDSKSFGFAKQSDSFLRVLSPCPGEDDQADDGATVGGIWRELASSQEAVSSYIITLIAKLISLDSGQGGRPLPDVYKDITEMHIDVTKYRQWCNQKSLPPLSSKAQAMSLQHAIISTIHFLKQFYGFSHTLHLRNMYLRWNIARNHAMDGVSLADKFERNVLSPFSVAASKDVIRDPLPVSSSSTSSPQQASLSQEEQLVRELVYNCYMNHRRAFFGSRPQDVCRLTKYDIVANSLSYIRLRDLIARSPALLSTAVKYVYSLLDKEVSHSQDYGEREVLLPLLHLFKEFIRLLASIDYDGVYRSLMGFYMWPVAYSENTKHVLDMLRVERKSRGTMYRRTILAEHDLGFNLMHYKYPSQSTMIFVDTTYPESQGSRLYQSLVNNQEKPSTAYIHRLLLRSVFQASPVDADIDLADLDSKILRLENGPLAQICEEAVDTAERAAAMNSEVEAEHLLTAELKKLHSRIEEASKNSEEQRDSAVSCNSDEKFDTFSFPLPAPFIPAYDLQHVHYSLMVDKLKEAITRVQQQATHPVTVTSTATQPELFTSFSSLGEMRSDLSNHSLDSGLEQDALNGDLPLKSPSELSSIRERDRTVTFQNGGIPRAVSPANKSDPGVDSARIVRHDSFQHPTRLSLDVSNRDDTGDNSSASDDTSETLSQGSLSRTMDRRSTVPRASNSLGYNSLGRRSTLCGRISLSMYNQAVSPTSSMGSVRGVKQRANPTASMKLKSHIRPRSASASVFSTMRSKTKVLKIILAGNDHIVSNAAKAYAHLRSQEPNLFWNLDIQFFHVPLSQASSGWVSVQGGNKTLASQNGELPEAVSDQQNDCEGGDVLIARYLAHMDSWYEKNVMLAMHNILRVLPSDSGLYKSRTMAPTEVEDTRWASPLTPSSVMVDILNNYLREANHAVSCKMFKIKMTIKSDKSNKIFDRREAYMLHQLDIQRLAGKKSNRQVKPYDASITMTELALDNSFIRGDMVHMKDVWTIRAINIPHPKDLGVPNPESECFELTITKASAEGGKFTSTKYRLDEENQYHAYELVVEARDKPLSVVVDGEMSTMTENVIRLEMHPASMEHGFSNSSTSHQTERHERQMHFPLMTYWPVDL